MVNHASVIEFVKKGGDQAVPGAIQTPAVEMVEDRLPRSIAFGKITPRRSGVQNPEDAVDEGAMGFTRAASVPVMRRVRKQRSDPSPLPVREFVSVHGWPPDGNHFSRLLYSYSIPGDLTHLRYMYKSLVFKQSLAATAAVTRRTCH
jgi:hypothetical protein